MWLFDPAGVSGRSAATASRSRMSGTNDSRLGLSSAGRDSIVVGDGGRGTVAKRCGGGGGGGGGGEGGGGGDGGGGGEK